MGTSKSSTITTVITTVTTTTTMVVEIVPKPPNTAAVELTSTAEVEPPSTAEVTAVTAEAALPPSPESCRVVYTSLSFDLGEGAFHTSRTCLVEGDEVHALSKNLKPCKLCFP